MPIQTSVLGAASDLNWIPLGRLLVDAGVVTSEQLEQALAVKEATGKRLGEIVVELGFTTGEVIAGANAAGDDRLYGAVGCSSCRGTGYRGRVALREVLPVQGEIRSLVERSTDEIFAAAVRQGMTTLRDDGMRLALAGVTSVDEIRRVTGLRLS